MNLAVAILMLATVTVCAIAMCWCVDTALKAIHEAVRRHDDCHKRSTRDIQAAALRLAAIRWESLDSENVLSRQASARKYKQHANSPTASIPAIWLRDEADRIEEER